MLPRAGLWPEIALNRRGVAECHLQNNSSTAVGLQTGATPAKAPWTRSRLMLRIERGEYDSTTCGALGLVTGLQASKAG